MKHNTKLLIIRITLLILAATGAVVMLLRPHHHHHQPTTVTPAVTGSPTAPARSTPAQKIIYKSTPAGKSTLPSSLPIVIAKPSELPKPAPAPPPPPAHCKPLLPPRKGPVRASLEATTLTSTVMYLAQLTRDHQQPLTAAQARRALALLTPLQAPTSLSAKAAANADARLSALLTSPQLAPLQRMNAQRQAFYAKQPRADISADPVNPLHLAVTDGTSADVAQRMNDAVRMIAQAAKR
jgi:hypothetical protein